MSFVSIPFAILLPSVLLLLWLARTNIERKIILLITSCVFYAYWDWRFLGLLAAVTVLDYNVSVYLAKTKSPRARRALLLVSIAVNLGFLGFFKYFDFFVSNLNTLLQPLHWHLGVLSIILPIGISFYTFETLSYVIDVYRGTAKPVRSLLDYAIFITFFPRLVAGPIMRASRFMPQLERGIQMTWPNILVGIQLFLRGLMKKLVVADNLAILVDQVYSSPNMYDSRTVWLTVLAYSIQIYFDFSGYTDMALGIGRMLGFELPPNFDLPYTSQSLTEFWTRWHISLSSWLRDYLYISLGGNRKGKIRTYINLMLTMLLGGLWHGASWNFVLWGGLHGSYLTVERMLFGKPSQGSWRSSLTWLRAVLVFIVVTITWVPFRAGSFSTTTAVMGKLLFLQPGGIDWVFTPALLAVPVVILGGFGMRRLNAGFPILQFRHAHVFAVLLAEALLVFYLSPTNVSPFIYFQF